MRPKEEVYNEIIKEIYTNFFRKNLKASDQIKHLRHTTQNFPLMSPSKMFCNIVKVTGEWHMIIENHKN